MFLSRIMNRSRDEERGSALIAVLGVMAVTAIIAVTVTASTVNSLGVTSSTRASVQARAAAEAGVDRALVDLQAACTTAFDSTTDPHYKYDLWYAMSSTSPAWNHGCPPDDAKLIRILSTGYASSPGVAGVSSGDSRTVEAVYAYIPVYVEVPQIDPAVYAHTMEGVFRNFVLNTASASIAADVMIKNGNVVCSNGATIDGSVILANGYVDLDRCNVNGDVHVSQWVNVGGTGTIITGDIMALGQGVAAGAEAVRLRSGIGEVQGSVYSAGDVRIEDLVRADVSLAGGSASEVRIDASGHVMGNVVSSGSIDNDGIVDGTVTSGFTGLAALPAPRVPDWTDIPYPSSSWDGYTEVMWSGSCSIDNAHAFWDSLATLTASTGNIVVNALGCGAAGLDFQNNIRNLVLSANISFVAWKFNVDKLVVDSNDTSTRYLWFAVPDQVDDDAPSCVGDAGGITLTSEADFQATIAAMVYTPCKITSDRNNWRGQYYGGSMEFLQQAVMTYVPVGVPGVDFDASLPPVMALDDALLGDRVSMRELGR